MSVFLFNENRGGKKQQLWPFSSSQNVRLLQQRLLEKMAANLLKTQHRRQIHSQLECIIFIYPLHLWAELYCVYLQAPSSCHISIQGVFFSKKKKGIHLVFHPFNSI